MSPATNRIVLASNGAYPRNGDSSEEQILRKALQGFEHGERTAVDVEDAENVVTRFLISEQARAGVELLTDGHVRWADPIFHLAAQWDGIVRGDERTLPGTQINYRVPRIVAKPAKKPDGPRSRAHEYRFARNALGLLPTSSVQAGRLSIKPVLIGPYTLARLSESDLKEFSSVESRAEAFAETLAAEIAALASSGATLIQVDEPAILSHPADWPIFRHSFARLAGARDAASHGTRRIQLALHVYGGEQTPHLDKFMQLAADILGLDFTCDAALLGAISGAGRDRVLSAGIICASTATRDDALVLRRNLEALLRANADSLRYVGAGSGLAGITRPVAFEKLATLRQILDQVT